MKQTLMVIVMFAVLSLYGGDIRLASSEDGATLSLVNGSPATVRVTLLIDPAIPAPALLVLRAAESGQRAETSISAAQLLKLRTLRLPAGWYELSLTLPHYRVASRSFRAAGESTALGEIALTPAPVITGVVRGAGRTALAGANISYGEGRAVSTSADGRFRVEIAGPWPEKLVVRKPGFGTKYLALSRTEATAVLPPIVLTAAAKVRVAIRRGAFTGPLDVSLGIHDEGAPARWLTRRSAGRGNAVVFGDLEAGTYAVLVAGPEPLERTVKQINVGAGDVRELVVPLSFVLAHGRLSLGGKPLAGMNVRFENIEGGWNSIVVTNGEGEVTTPIWQTGRYSVSIRKGDWGAPIVRDVDLDARSFADFAIDVPDRRVSGRVLDEDGAPVANALVVLRTHADRITRTIRMYTEDDGRFEFNGVAAGDEVLRVLPQGFLRPDPKKFSLAERDRVHEETIAVQRGRERQIRVLGRDGAPVARAEVVVSSGDRTRAVAMTDERGRAKISAPSDGESIIFVFPKEGSLAAHRLGRDDANIRIDIPSPNASINIATLTTEGTAVPNVDLLVRYNGEVLPPDVLREIQSYRGLSFETDERGAANVQHLPAGTYEFWPYRSEGEADSLLASVSAITAPIIVNAGTGENKVTVRFRKK